MSSKNCCIDSCVWIKYAGTDKATTLIKLIRQNDLTVFADNYLLSEVHKALYKEFDFTIREADKLILLIMPFIIVSAPRNIYRFAPDPKDNFLYDICIQNSCSILITTDRELLLDDNAPFSRKTDSWLKRLR